MRREYLAILLMIVLVFPEMAEGQRGYRRDSESSSSGGGEVEDDDEGAGTVSWRKRRATTSTSSEDVSRHFEASDAEEDDGFYGNGGADDERVSARDMKDNSATDEYGREWNSPYETSDVTMAVLVAIGLAFIIVPIWMTYGKAASKKKSHPSEILKKKLGSK